MATQTLKSLIGKKNDATALVTSFIQQLNAEVFIEDADGKLLLGNICGNPMFEFTLSINDIVAGFVKGDTNAQAIYQLVLFLFNKEAEKKKLGNEVLNLYHEVNMMFNFSEQLAQAIGAADICKITLAETSRIIKADNGVIVLWHKAERLLKVMASVGELFFNQETINNELPLLSKIVFNGQAEIFTDIDPLKEASIVLPQVQSIIYASLKVKQRVMGAIILASNNGEQYSAANLKLLTTLSLQASAAIESALLYEKSIKEAQESEAAMRRIYEATNKFVPHEFIRSLGHNVITDVSLGDQVEKIVTVLFSDIRNYTTLSEQMTPKENFNFVCSFNERMGPIIKQYNGFINQYLGDAIMAIFPGEAYEAVAAAIAMQKEVQEFNRQRADNNEPAIQIGVGMHTGPLIMGITGDANRMDATTISDTVNTASRLETLTKHYKGKIIISAATLHEMREGHGFMFRHLGMVHLKGKISAIAVYECFSGDDDGDFEKKHTTLSQFNDGVDQYIKRSFDKAVINFKHVIEAHPNDLTAKFFYDNAVRYYRDGIPEDWTGVEEMAYK